MKPKFFRDLAHSRLRDHSDPEISKSSPFAKVNYCQRSFVNAATEDLYVGISKAAMSDVQQSSIGRVKIKSTVPRAQSRQHSNSFGPVQMDRANIIEKERPHTASITRNNRRTGHLVRDFFTYDKGALEPPDHEKYAGKIWILSGKLVWLTGQIVIVLTNTNSYTRT
jgi:hypothetical protein